MKDSTYVLLMLEEVLNLEPFLVRKIAVTFALTRLAYIMLILRAACVLLVFQIISHFKLKAWVSVLNSSIWNLKVLSKVYFQTHHSWNDTFKVTEYAPSTLSTYAYIQIRSRRRKNVFKLFGNPEMLSLLRNALKMFDKPGQPDLGRCHSVGTSAMNHNNIILIENFSFGNSGNYIDHLYEGG